MHKILNIRTKQSSSSRWNKDILSVEPKAAGKATVEAVRLARAGKTYTATIEIQGSTARCR